MSGRFGREHLHGQPCAVAGLHHPQVCRVGRSRIRSLRRAPPTRHEEAATDSVSTGGSLHAHQGELHTRSKRESTTCRARDIHASAFASRRPASQRFGAKALCRRRQPAQPAAHRTLPARGQAQVAACSQKTPLTASCRAYKKGWAATCRRAPVAQLDRAPDYGSGGWGFKSLRARHLISSASAHLLLRPRPTLEASPHFPALLSSLKP